MSGQLVLSQKMQQATQLIMAQESNFMAIRVDEAINFRRESEFALQLLQANDYTLNTAMGNPKSLQDAIRNVAAIGVTLNPAEKHAYLVPRDGKICLDLSAKGLLQLAIDTGALFWGQARIVYKGDHYQNNGIDQKPTHNYKAFADRGEIIGAYCVVKTATGDFLTEEMTAKEIFAIRARSQSYKSGKNSPWISDEGEMIKKTVIKRASKYWPKSERVALAIDMLNKNGEGIENAPADGPAFPAQITEIHGLLADTDTDEAQVLSYASTSLFGRPVEFLAELSITEATKLIAILQQKKGAMAKKGSS